MKVCSDANEVLLCKQFGAKESKLFCVRKINFPVCSRLNLWVEKRQRGPEHPVTRARARVKIGRVRKLEKRGVGGVGSKMVKNGHFWAKNGQNRPFLGIFGQIFFFFSRFLPSIAPRLKAPCPSGSRPPIYTVLNAAFSALNTLSGGTVVGHHSPAASHGLPEHFPREVSTFPTSPPNYAE